MTHEKIEEYKNNRSALQFAFGQSINLMISGLLNDGIELEETLDWLREVVIDYEKEIEEQSKE